MIFEQRRELRSNEPANLSVGKALSQRTEGRQGMDYVTKSAWLYNQDVLECFGHVYRMSHLAYRMASSRGSAGQYSVYGILSLRSSLRRKGSLAGIVSYAGFAGNWQLVGCQGNLDIAEGGLRRHKGVCHLWRKAVTERVEGGIMGPNSCYAATRAT